MTNRKDADLQVAADGPPVTPASVPRLLTSLCGGGSCPAIYHTDRDTLLVQGHAVAGIVTPDGELVVEIPSELLLEAARRIQEQETLSSPLQ